MRAEIITVGTELLLGEIVDTNAATLARALRELGIDLFRTQSVGDNRERIARALRESTARAELILLAGGLGPTVDDVTREGVALASSRPLHFQPALWDQIQLRFAQFGSEATHNNRKQARLPEGAFALENRAGTAPGFILELGPVSVIALPGVPEELEAMLEESVLPFLRQGVVSGFQIRTRILRTAGVGESWLDERIQDLERLSNPTVGLAAHAGRVDIRITAKAQQGAELQSMLKGIETTLRERLGSLIFGVDEDTLESVALPMLEDRSWDLVVAEAGAEAHLLGRLARAGGRFIAGELRPEFQDPDAFQHLLAALQKHHGAQAALGLAIAREGGRQIVRVACNLPIGEKRLERSYAGPPANASVWGANLALNELRLSLLGTPDQH
jgi:nicotinamide-nucleotide amidase